MANARGDIIHLFFKEDWISNSNINCSHIFAYDISSTTCVMYSMNGQDVVETTKGGINVQIASFMCGIKSFGIR